MSEETNEADGVTLGEDLIAIIGDLQQRRAAVLHLIERGYPDPEDGPASDPDAWTKSIRRLLGEPAPAEAPLCADLRHEHSDLESDMILSIRRLTDQAGHDGVPFLDDAVRNVIIERDQSRAALRCIGNDVLLEDREARPKEVHEILVLVRRLKSTAERERDGLAVANAELGNLVLDLRRENEALKTRADEAEASAEIHRILAMSDEEVVAEIRAAGCDPDEFAERTRALVLRTVEKWKAERAASTGVDAAAVGCPCDGEADDPGPHVHGCAWNDPAHGAPPFGEPFIPAGHDPKGDPRMTVDAPPPEDLVEATRAVR